ncbi:twin-arginine translocation signal domain-containing protein [Candidatus Woesearchaeota archaeon]|nr:twin-arginine translocation signal domain-containing protein [Candidatus Woesearchaeota archaeon]
MGQTKKLSRREFLRLSALTAAGAALAGCFFTPTEPQVVEKEQQLYTDIDVLGLDSKNHLALVEVGVHNNYAEGIHYFGNHSTELSKLEELLDHDSEKIDDENRQAELDAYEAWGDGLCADGFHVWYMAAPTEKTEGNFSQYKQKVLEHGKNILLLGECWLYDSQFFQVATAKATERFYRNLFIQTVQNGTLEENSPLYNRLQELFGIIQGIESAVEPYCVGVKQIVMLMSMYVVKRELLLDL